MARGIWAVVVLAAVVAPVVQGQSQEPPLKTGTGAISGRVLDLKSRSPIANAQVSLDVTREQGGELPMQDSGDFIRTVQLGWTVRVGPTDSEGRFTFANLPSGVFQVRADKLGFWPSYLTLDGRSDGKWIVLHDGERVTTSEIPIARWPSISGRAVDERGDPIAGLTVKVLPPGSRHSQYGPSGITDDRGIYSIPVAPGTYTLSITGFPFITNQAIARPRTAFPPTFYPNQRTPEAATQITIAIGDVREGFDFVVSPEPVYRVSVALDGSEAGRQTTVKLFTVRADGEPDSEAIATAVGQSSTVVFSSVPAGRYVARAQTLPDMPYMSHGTAPLRELPPGTTLSAEQSIVVTDRDVDVRVAMRPGARITGHVVFEGALPKPALKDLSNRTLLIEPVNSMDEYLRGAYLPDDRFSTIQLPPGRYVVNPSAPLGWRLKSVMADGRDIRDYPIDIGTSDISGVVITFTDATTRLEGRIVMDKLDDMHGGWITVFPFDRALWSDYGIWPRRIKFLQTGRSGEFKVDVAPGTYYVAATSQSTRGRITATELARLATTASTVAVNERQTARVDVRFSRGR